MEYPDNRIDSPELIQAIDSEHNEPISLINDGIDFTHETNDDDKNAPSHECDDNKINIETDLNEETRILSTEVADLIISNTCSNELSVNSNSIESLQSQCQQMQQLLIQKEDFIALQKRELEVLEKEKQGMLDFQLLSIFLGNKTSVDLDTLFY